MKIDRTIEECTRLAGGLLREHRHNIAQAIMNLEQEIEDEGNPKLSISLSLVIEAMPENRNAVVATISFTEKKCKDKSRATVDENQRELPLGDERGESF